MWSEAGSARGPGQEGGLGVAPDAALGLLVTERVVDSPSEALPASLSKGLYQAIPPLISEYGTIPKVASMVSILPHAQSSHSAEGVVWASLDDKDLFDDEFQTHHTPICHVVWQEEYNCYGSVEGMDFTRGSPTYLPYY